MAEPTTQPLFLGDSRYEAKFQEWHLEYRLEPAFPIDQLRVADWAQVRSANHVAPQDEIEEYRQQMAAGAAFPPVILMAPDTLIDGNTRLGAARKLHKKTIAAYLINFPSVPMAKSLAGAINNMGGKRLSAEEAVDAAKLLMDMHFADEAIAREIGRSPEQVRRIRNQLEFAERTLKLHLENERDRISMDNRARLNSVKHDPVFGEFVEFVAQAVPAKKTITDLLKQVNAAPSDADAISAIVQARREYSSVGPPPRDREVSISGTVRQVGMHISALVKLSADPEALFDPREDKREERSQQWQQVAQLSVRMLELYQPARELVTA